MRKSCAIARRILLQFKHDARTLVLLFVAPVVALWLLSVLLGADAAVPKLAAVDMPEEVYGALEEQDVCLVETGADEAERALRANEVDAALFLEDDGTLRIWAEGGDATKTSATVAAVSAAVGTVQQDAMEAALEDMTARGAAAGSLPGSASGMVPGAVSGSVSVAVPGDDAASAASDSAALRGEMDATAADALPVLPARDAFDPLAASPVSGVETELLHGEEDWGMLDYYGPVFVGVLLFVFVFLTSGISIVNEKTSGTMERFLAMPVGPLDVVGGYTLSFGALALVQAIIILTASLGFIGFPCEGSIALVLFTAVTFALVSVTMGLLVSGLASSAFQVIQLIILFIMPQILLSGLFDLSAAPGWMQALSNVFPATYAVDALRDVMLRGAGIADIASNLAVLWGFIAVFFLLASLKFRKKKAHA